MSASAPFADLGAFGAVSAGLFGLVIGSFVNVLAHRLPRGESVVHPGSHCPACGAPVRGRDNIPLVSWLLLGARCRDCRAPISVLDPAQVERVVQELRAAEERRQTVDPHLPARLVMDRLAVESFFRNVEGERHANASSLGLVGTGIAALVGMLTAADA